MPMYLEWQSDAVNSNRYPKGCAGVDRRTSKSPLRRNKTSNDTTEL
jgi:hypothetical protein